MRLFFGTWARGGLSLVGWALAVALGLAVAPLSAPAAERGDQAPSASLLTINYPPLAYYEHGELTGLAVDIVRAALGRTGRAGTVEMGAFADVCARAESAPGAALFPLSRVPPREGRFRWVGPLLMEEIALYARKGDGVRPTDIEGARHVRGIAVVRGYASGRHLRDLGFANLVEFKYPSQCAEALVRGRVGLWLSSSATMASLARQADIDPSLFEKTLSIAEFPAYLAFSRATAPEVVQSFVQALSSMTRDGSLGRIRARWQARMDQGVGPRLTPPGVLSLSSGELKWIESAPVLRMGVHRDRVPVDFMRDGRHSGLAAMVMEELATRSGLRFETVPMDSNGELRAALADGAVDLVAEWDPRPGDGALHTQAYAEFPYVIVVRKGGKSVTWLDELSGKPVAVARGNAAADMLAGGGYGIRPEPFDTEEQALGAVSRGDLDAYVGSLASVGYLLHEQKPTNLRVSGRTGLEPLRCAVAVRPGLPILRDILDEALHSLSGEERGKLLAASVPMADDALGEVPFSSLWWAVGAAALLAGAAAMGGWALLLRRELGQCHARIDESEGGEARIRRLMRVAGLGGFCADANTGLLLEADWALADMLGYDDPVDLLESFRLPGLAGDQAPDDGGFLPGEGGGFGDMNLSVRHRDGHPVWLRMSGYVSRDGLRVWGVAQDISMQMRMAEEMRRTEEECRVVLDAIPFHVAMQGADRRFRKVNAAGERLLGLSRDRILGSHVGDIVPAEVWRLLKPAEDKALGGKMAEMDVQTDFARRDGCYRAYYSPHVDAFGMVHGFVSCLIDVTDRRRAERALANSEERYRLTVEQAHDAIVISSMEGAILYGNSSAAALFGISLDQARGMNIQQFVQTEDRDMIASFLGHQESFTYGVRMISRDGRALFVENSRSLIQYGGEPAVLVHIRDVSDRKRAMEDLRENEQRLQLALDSTEYGMWEIRLDANTVHLPPRVFCENFGYSADEASLTLQEFGARVHPEDYPLGRDMFRAYVAGRQGVLRHEFRISDALGRWRWILAHGKIVERDNEDRPVRLLGMVQDVTDRVHTEARLREMATTDPLTGLANRRSFMDAAQRELNRATRYGTVLSLLMLDLDHFKAVNDTHGHDVGDDVLCAMAEAMRGALRDVDTPGRLGGEEFAVLLPETGIGMATGAAERLREWMGGMVVEGRDGAEVRCTVSIGVAQAVEGEELKDFLARADEAMYEAKRKGRNRVEVSPV